MKEASGEVKVANLASNIAALITFLMHGVVWIGLGLTAAVFSIAGNYLGAGMVMKDGTKIVRPIVIVVLGLLFREKSIRPDGVRRPYNPRQTLPMRNPAMTPTMATRTVNTLTSQS